MVLKAIHLICGASLFGLFIIQYFYFCLSIRKGDLLWQTVRFSFYLDACILPLIIALFFSGFFLIAHTEFTIRTPWIEAAFFLLSLLTTCWIVSFVIKYRNYKSKEKSIFSLTGLFHCCYVFIFLILIGIIHDAVMKSTYFTW